MSVTGETLARRRAQRPLLTRTVLTVLERGLQELVGGSFEVRLPDGSLRTMGNGPPLRVEVTDERLFSRLALSGSVGLGEAYQEGEWRADDLVSVLSLLLRNAETGTERHRVLANLAKARPRPNRRQGLASARRNIAAHYDLGTPLFELMLDRSLTYSCAIFEHPDESLEEAQLRKLRRVCEKLGVRDGDRVLEIGCGFGSFALVAAGEYGARVTGLTLSRDQAERARQRVTDADLGGRVAILEEDYREHRGRYEKLVSIEMIEAIGERQYPAFFAACDRMLQPGGSACVQTILVPDARWPRYRRGPDWIERHIFPGCLIPSLAALTAAMARTSRLTVSGLEEIGEHYAGTLNRWRASFLGGLDEIRRLGYDERFVRTWDFYLAFCEAAFRTRWLRDAQIVLTR